MNSKKLISITEAEDNSPQNVVFCVPIDHSIARKIITLDDFQEYFGSGIKTKIQDSDITRIIRLDFNSSFSLNPIKKNDLPKFTAYIKSHKIEFTLSALNFSDSNIQKNVNIDFTYTGSLLSELHNKKLVILEPLWSQLDRLFIEENILFTDWS